MNTDADFARYARPEFARLFRALNLDVTYLAGRGDHLTAGSPGDSGTEVLDLVGGAGSSLFGHNHPALLDVARRCLDEQLPFNAQASVRPGAAELAERLSAVVGSTTGASYVVTLGSTGADAVEGAVKHATVERRRRLAALQEEFERSLRRIRRDGLADVPCASGPAAGRRCAEVLGEALDRIAGMRRVDPLFVSLRNAFHGKTTGAGSLTHGGNVPADLHVPGPRHRRLDDWAPGAVVTALDAELVEICSISVDAAGVPHSAARRLSPLAAAFVEPIQGESGVHEVPVEVLAALRELADRHEAALVFDEIQCGMGRTGTFLASEGSGVVADYYLFSKSLGGGLAKISALLVDERRYVPEFGRHHTSTFADDDFSSRIATAAVELSAAYRDRIVELGELLRDRLSEVAQRWPDAIVEVRGRGLLLGVEFVLPQPDSGLLREVFDSESLGYLIAGRLLHAHRIRVIPTLSAPTTVRIQPSALLEPAEVDRIATAFEDVAGLLAKGDYATLLEHLTTPATTAWRPKQHVPLPRRDRPEPGGGRRADVPRVAFLANVDVPAKVWSLAPELAAWSEEQCAAALDRMWGELDPYEVARHRIRSAAGGEVEVIMVAAPFTAAQAVAALQAGHGAWLRRTVLDAVELGVSLGAEVIGLGGHTSIVTSAARDVVEDDIRVTSGNSLTAACAHDLLQRQLARAGAGARRVGLVGGIGNIGAVMAELVAPHCESLLLVGRPGSARRLARVADRLGHLADVSIAEDLGALRDCPIVVTATNSADPVIRPEHLAGDREVLVCDLAVPGDVHPAVEGLPNVTVVSGGRVGFPGEQAPHFPGITLPPGTAYSCMAETIMLGFDVATASPSYGGLSVAGVLAARELAVRHGFHPARIVADDVSVQPWVDRSSETTEEQNG
ncbi:Acetylornithine/succinyldiaminopimelate/putrescine aminotransferase [Saccharopolyspora kobensis]|uniref:Acetylornithine/succinyldiaminopimelate/putrescine aminotransferase n=1 Tax=Saccharopolyspora kobensis TaxID=146035 RepID=A0A1H6A5G6_9PSEU|nr:aminotransferase class III-fold pyridoxal phosphate-dependent enzyme [Saccharopolyspora kobensis]SEG42986.1 Acetylornithine/succinyldiaminopimelate/putrescine aminotransferase [Saccharopolyspora kobensis]SFE18712.1 Acetylornithine/succinyldiaminopimelate/putrescine aminotransferase [Saccharopolyspora kobensis]